MTIDICCVQFISKSFLHKSSYLHNNSKHKALHHWIIMFTSLTHCSDVFGNMDLVKPPCHYPTDLLTIRSNLWSITAMTFWSWRCHVVIMTCWHDNMTVWDPPLYWQHPVTKSQWAGPGQLLHTAHWVNTGLSWAEWSGVGQINQFARSDKSNSHLNWNIIWQINIPLLTELSLNSTLLVLWVWSSGQLLRHPGLSRGPAIGQIIMDIITGPGPGLPRLNPFVMTAVWSDDVCFIWEWAV